MGIEFHCPQCGTFLTAPSDRAGQIAVCPSCGADVQVPDPSDEWDALPAHVSIESAADFEATQSRDFGRSQAEWLPCPACGARAHPEATVCSFCGTALIRPESRPVRRPLRPHRGEAILALGVLSWFFCCFPLGIVAWVMGDEDLRQIREGRMDAAGSGLVRFGKLLGAANVLVSGAVILLWCVVFPLAVRLGLL